MNEKDIQKFIWSKRDDFSSLLIEPTFPAIEEPSVTDMNPSEILYQMVIDRYKEYWQCIKEMDLWGCEVTLKEEDERDMRTDFLGNRPGGNGIIVVELKKSGQTARQAFTELPAYGSFLRTLFTPSSKNDIMYLLISPMGERIVEQAAINQLVYDNNKVCVLESHIDREDLNTLKLSLWIPQKKIFDGICEAAFAPKCIDIYKVVWENLRGDWSPKGDHEYPNEYMKHRMIKVAQVAAQMMESCGLHGFVYTSQMWSEALGSGFLGNSIVIGAINPYKVTKTKFYYDNNFGEWEKCADVDFGGLGMMDIIPALKGYAKDLHDRDNYLKSLADSWGEDMTIIARYVVETMTKTLSGRKVEIDKGCFDWKNLFESGDEDYSDPFDFHFTGILRDLFFRYTEIDFEYLSTCNEDEREFHPYCLAGYDVPEELVDMVFSPTYAKLFLKRLYNPLIVGPDDI